MKRGYTKQWFLNICDKIRKKIPNVRITTDIIVGFPDESDDEFEDTIDVMKKVKFNQIFNFKYSPRPNTQALNIKNEILPDVATSRLTKIIELHKLHQDELMAKNFGKILVVFFEELKPNGEVSGFSDKYKQDNTDGSEEPLGQFKKEKITTCNRTSLKGILVEK
jgi:tRNA-2-methylthio-N6-dimethylallyladenosine synthase